MFCPRCAQQQLNDESRFCPRCGLPLAGVASLLASEGAVQGQGSAPSDKSNGRRADIRRGAKIIFLSAVLAPVFLALGIAFDSPGPLLVPATIFLAGLSWLLYSLFFGE